MKPLSFYLDCPELLQFGDRLEALNRAEQLSILSVLSSYLMFTSPGMPSDWSIQDEISTGVYQHLDDDPQLVGAIVSLETYPHHELLLVCEAIATFAASRCRLQAEFFRQLSGAGVPQQLAFTVSEILSDDTVPTRRTPQQQASVDAAHAIIQVSDEDLEHLFDAESFDFDLALAE